MVRILIDRILMVRILIDRILMVRILIDRILIDRILIDRPPDQPRRTPPLRSVGGRCGGLRRKRCSWSRSS